MRQERTGLGPFAFASEAPFLSSRLALRPRAAETLSRGRWRLELVGDWANLFAFDEQDRQYRLDQEAVTAAVEVAVGVGGGVELSLGVDERRRFGGILDGPVQEFHDLFGLDQGGREQFPRGDFALELTPLEGPQAVVGPEGKGGYARSITVSVRQQLLAGRVRAPAVAWRVTAREALRVTDLEEDGSLDWGVDLTASKRFGRWLLHGTLGWLDWGDDRYLGFPMRDEGVLMVMAAEWNRRPGRSWLLQLQRNDAQLFDYRPFDEPIYELLVGWKRSWPEGTELGVALLENVATATNSPDFGFHLSVSRRF